MMTVAWAFPIEFEQPKWLLLCLLIPILVVVAIRSLAGLDPIRRVLAVLIRSVLVLLTACCLAGIQSVRRSEALTVVFVMDRSHSVEKLEGFQEEFIRTASKNPPAEDRLALVDFARVPVVEQLPLKGGLHIPPGRLPPMPHPDRTDVASALRRAMAIFPSETAKRIVLLSDGNDNMGDLLGEARRAKADGIPVDVVPLRYVHRNEVYFDRMIAPSHAEPGEQVPIRMVLYSDKHVTGRLYVFQNGVAVDIPSDLARQELQPGKNTLFIKLPVREAGVQTYEAVFRPDDEAMDVNAQNNRASAFSFVSGASTALLITENPVQDVALYDALLKEDVQVAMRSTADLGEFGLLQMSNFATILLANVPAASFTDDQHKDFATYVRDLGSGLVMLGGDEGFGAGGWIGTPMEEVMPVSFEIKHKRVLPKGALVIIMHSCEIPRGEYYGKEMAKKAVDTISSQDLIGVLSYNWGGGPNWDVPLDLNTNKAAVKSKIDRLQNGDMPDFGTTMLMAYEGLTKGKGRDAAQKHVILISDGDPQPPAASLLADFKREKITVSTIGIGWGQHVMTKSLEDVATATDGRFYDARNPKALPQIFVKESKVVRRPLLVDEPFQPHVVFPDSELLAGVEAGTGALPPLGGMVLTSPKASPNVLVPIIRATNDGDDPVLAYWQCELGKTVAFTSGWWPAWGERWTAWPKFAKFWAQVVRWSMRQEAPANFDTYTRIEGNRGRIIIDALDKDASYLNFLQLNSKVVGPDNKHIAVRFAQTGPGHYEATFDAENSGQYLASIQVRDRGDYRGTIQTGFTIPHSPEYRDLMTNEALLRQVAELTGGRWLDRGAEEANVFGDRPRPVAAKQPTWDWVLAWLLLPAFLLDVAVRRLASWLALSIAVEVVVLFVLLFGLGIGYGPLWGIIGAILLAELIGWTIRFRSIRPLFEFVTHTVAVLGQAGERSAVALDKLKTVRERARDDLEAPQTPSSPEASAPSDKPIPLEPSGRRFEIGEPTPRPPVQDLKDVPGTTNVNTGAGPKKPPSGDAAPPEAATSRLLRAKKRVKRDLEDKKE